MLSFTCRALAPGQKVSIFVNEKPAGTIEVGTASKRYDVKLPAAALKRRRQSRAVHLPQRRRAGERPAQRRRVHQDRARPGGRWARRRSTPAPVAARDVELGGTRKRALVVGGKGSRLSFYLQIPETGRLAVSFGAPGGAADVARARRGRRPADAHGLPGARRAAAGPTPRSTWARRRGTRRASISSRAAARSPGAIRASWSRRRPGRGRSRTRRSTTSSSGWSTPCAPTRCTSTTRRRACRRRTTTRSPPTRRASSGRRCPAPGRCRRTRRC